MSKLPPGLEDFGHQLRAAAAADIERRKAETRTRRSWRRLVLPVSITAITAAAGAGAVRVVDGGSGPPIRAEQGDGAGLQAPRDPGVVAASATEDPEGGPPWIVRVYTATSGQECVQIGRLRDGVFGQLQERRFRALPSEAPGVCGPPSRSQSLLAVERRSDPARTLVFGLAASRAPLEITVDGQRRSVQPAGLGAFAAVFDLSGKKRDVVVREQGAPPRRLG